MESKRKRISLETKISVLTDIDNNIKYSEIKEKYQLVNLSQISKIKREKERILNAYKNGNHFKMKSLKGGQFDAVEKDLVKWVNDMNGRNVQVTMMEMEAKVQQIIKKERINGLKGGRGYIEYVMRRNNMGIQIKHGEALSVNEGTINDWKIKLNDLIRNYDENIFNADELGLFYKTLPSKTIGINLLSQIKVSRKNVVTHNK